MKKITAIILLFVLCLSLTGCSGGVVLDENEVIEGNGTERVVKGGSVYEIKDGVIEKDGAILYRAENATKDCIFALGQYLYVNTDKGAMQLKLDGSKMKKFGSGEIIAAGGRYLYYQSKDNKVGTMIVYKIDMIDGSQRNLFQDTIVSVEMIEEGVFLFKGESGNEYVNELGEDDGYFYHEWVENN